MAVLPVGLARGHKGNPAASLRVKNLYGTPVLLSGISALVLCKSEINVLHHHYKLTLERLQKLHKSSPECVVYFLGGSLPLTALLHLLQLSLLGMIARLGANHILHKHGSFVLSATNPPSSSWFAHIRSTCKLYSIDDPLHILTNPPAKTTFKFRCKSLVVDFWEKKLRYDVAKLKSLEHFHANFYSLVTPHPIWTSCGNNPYEVEKASIQARMLSGRYRTCWLSRYWSGDPSGNCTLPNCRLSPTPGTLRHILTDCQDLSPARDRVFSLWSDYIQKNPILAPIVVNYWNNLQFLLDCSVLPDVITLAQEYGSGASNSLFYLTRTLCFSIHKARSKLLGKWNTQ